MTDDPDRTQPRRSAFTRFLRWQPRTHVQVWLSAAAQALSILTIYAILAATTSMRWSPMWFGYIAVIALFTGLTQSYRLHQRRNKTRQRFNGPIG